MVVKVWLKSLAGKVGYVVAALIIISAVFVSVVQFVTPVLDEHRADFEKIASDLLHNPVAIKSVQVSWYRYQPVISLNAVSILNKETKEQQLKINKVDILFSIPQTLFQRKLVTSGIMVSGSKLTVNESSTGEMTVQEFSSLALDQQTTNETKFTDVMGWLSQEPRLILHDIDLHYTGLNGKKRFITLYDLSFENTALAHKISGKAILHQDLPTEVSLTAQWQGKPINFKEITGQAYVYVSGLSLSQWTKASSWKGWQVNQGVGSAKIWATWTQGTLQSIQSTFQSFGIELYSQKNKMTHKINRISGNVGWKRQDGVQIFAGNDILIDLPQHLWPVTSFNLSLTPDANGVLSLKSADFGYVDLSDTQAFLFSSADLVSDSVNKILGELKLKGSLQNASIALSGPWNDWKNISLNTRFSELSFLPVQKYPGVRNISGFMRWNNSQGEFQLNSKHAGLQFHSIFDHEILIDQLSGDVKLQHDQKNNWLMRIASLHLLNNDAAANVSGTVTLPPNASPILDINANMTMQKVQNISQYLPVRVLDPDLATWLREAFLSGEVRSGHAILRGALQDFPFDKNKGELNVTAKVNNIDLQFAPNWPSLRHINASLAFTGRKITIDVDHAETLGVPITGVHAVIPYLGDTHPQILEIQTGLLQTDFAQVMKYVDESPLDQSIGKMFSGVDLQGPIDLKLGLNIPLSDTDKTQVKGDLTLKECVMHSVPWNLKLDHLNGKVKFTETTAEAKQIHAELFNKPFQFDLTPKHTKNKKSVVRASFANHLNLSDIEDWLHISFSKYIHGATDVNGNIDFSMTEPVNLHLRSNLVGATIDLQEQYGKKAHESRDFSADIILQNDKPIRLKLDYNNLLSTAITLERKQEKYSLINADLRFGSGEANWPTNPGLFISGQFKELDLAKIKTYLQPTATEGSSSFTLPPLKEIDIRADKLKFGSQTLTQLRLQATPSQNNWNVYVNSSEVVGQITVPVNFNRQGMITAQLQKINMRSTSDSTQSNFLIDVKSLPGISLIANDVKFDDMLLGKIIFKATPSNNGLKIQNLQITSTQLDLRATGDWTQNGNTSMTHLLGSASTQNTSALLNGFGLDVRNFISSNGKLNYDLTWRDAAFAPTLASMNGNASLSLGQGRIVDIGDQGGVKMDIGRMLSIFSLQTIPRRLTLDFSDVFEKGYSFDSVRGDFTVQNGDVYTKNMRIDGPVAQVGINGRIGLKNKDYDFILDVTAHVTSSIPVAVTLLTNPLIGLGALAINTVIGSKVSSVTTNYYAVTGPWNNPKWTSIKSSQRKS